MGTIRLSIAQAERAREMALIPLDACKKDLASARADLLAAQGEPLSPDQQTRIVGLERYIEAKLPELGPLEQAAGAARAEIARRQNELTQAIRRRDVARDDLDKVKLPDNIDCIVQATDTLVSELGQSGWRGLHSDMQRLKETMDEQRRAYEKARGSLERWELACAPAPDLDSLPEPASQESPLAKHYLPAMQHRVYLEG